jgi:hypothetical protein
MQNEDGSSCDFVTDEVQINLNMLRAVVLHWIG